MWMLKRHSKNWATYWAIASSARKRASCCTYDGVDCVGLRDCCIKAAHLAPSLVCSESAVSVARFVLNVECMLLFVCSFVLAGRCPIIMLALNFSCFFYFWSMHKILILLFSSLRTLSVFRFTVRMRCISLLMNLQSNCLCIVRAFDCLRACVCVCLCVCSNCANANV